MTNSLPRQKKEKPIKPKITTVSIQGDVSYDVLEAVILREFPNVTVRLWSKRQAQIQAIAQV